MWKISICVKKTELESKTMFHYTIYTSNLSLYTYLMPALAPSEEQKNEHKICSTHKELIIQSDLCKEFHGRQKLCSSLHSTNIYKQSMPGTGCSHNTYTTHTHTHNTSNIHKTHTKKLNIHKYTHTTNTTHTHPTQAKWSHNPCNIHSTYMFIQHSHIQ